MIAHPDLEPAAIRAARERIDPVFTDSPQYVHEGLSARLGVPVIVKVETVNPIRSFKGRGTWVVMAALAGEGTVGPERAVVCVSAGNFGQGVAYAARALGVPAVVFCSTRANRAKVARMRALGATVIESGDDFDDARGASEAYAAERARDAAGRRRRRADLDRRRDHGARGHRRGRRPGTCRCPSSRPCRSATARSSTASGRGCATRRPDCRVLGIQAEAAAAMTLSWRAGRPIDTDSAATYADGIASRVAIPRAVELMRGRVDDMITVSEDALRAAQAELTEELGITVEGAAAASWAGLLAGERPAGPALVIVTGSNA